MHVYVAGLADTMNRFAIVIGISQVCILLNCVGTFYYNKKIKIKIRRKKLDELEEVNWNQNKYDFLRF